jgi:uncharacterized membrane protein
MFPVQIAFDRPWYLLLLALVPLLWWSSYRSLAGLGRWRRLMALTLRTAVMLLLILALAEAQWVRSSDRLTVIYLLDQSLSIPEAQRESMIAYFNQSIQRHRNPDREDRVAVIPFGRDAAVEIPPLDDDVQMAPAIESPLDPEYTNLAGAMQMALALFPHDAAKRVVIVSDGNQNLGDGISQARLLIEKGVSIDVVPVQLQVRGEVAVEKITMPPDVRRGQPFDLRVVLNHTARPRSTRPVKGKLRIIRKQGEREMTLAEQDVSLPPGKQVLSVREEIVQPDFYTYEARFEPAPDSPADDAMPQNNRATTFTHVRGRGHVLIVEDWANPGEFDALVERLRGENLEVTVQSSDKLFGSLAELQRYDTVVLANVPRSSGDDATNVTHFSDEQIQMLVRNTHDMGSGLVMLGGPNSFGAGGWTNTELERAMPVDFEVKSPKVAPVGALALIMHASEIAQGNYWQKVVAQEAIKALGTQDYCGLIHWEGTDQWLWGQGNDGGLIPVGPNRKRMLARLDRMTPGDMPYFDPAMQMAAQGFDNLSDAAIKHMIMISDGDPQPASNGTLQYLKRLGVRVTTVAVGAHGPAGHAELQRIATFTGGKYYVVSNPQALPRIYQREARRVARPLVYEDEKGLVPQVKYPHEMIKGLPGAFPPVTGFVLTTVKDSHLVEVVLTSPRPATEVNNTLLAGWTYGLGKAVVLTTDAGKRWAASWTGWEHYDKLFSQIIRWSMRPVGDTGKFTVATDVAEGKARLVVTALDQADQFLNFLDMSATVVGPDMKTLPVKMRQTAPGRYVADFDAADAGSYFLMINPGAGQAPIRTGINVGYSDEYLDRETNMPLLTTLASLAPRDAQPGQMVAEPNRNVELEELLKLNHFRHDLPRATASQGVWHLLVLVGACTFFFDVFVRRVHVNLAWAAPVATQVRDFLLRRQAAPAETETMSRLQRSKEEVGDRIESRRTSARFEPATDEPATAQAIEQAMQLPRDSGNTAPPTPSRLAPDKQEDTYTERLLKAKKKVWEQHPKREPGEEGK